ncbi:MAG: SDR family NAD(P)-dependent oxidoreductase, partial [Pseudomonadota bacterium]
SGLRRKPEKRTLHATAGVFPLIGDAAEKPMHLPDAGHLTVSRSPEELYTGFAGFSMQYGPLFQPITELHLDEARTEVLAKLELPSALKEGAGEYIAHPSLLDGCLQTVLSLLDPKDGAFLPTLIRDLRVHRSLSHRLWCHGKLTHRSNRTVECDLTLMNDAGEIEATLSGLVCSALQLQRQNDGYPAGDLKYAWHAEALPASDTVNRDWLVVSRDDAWPAAPLFERLSQDGQVRFVSLSDVDAGDVLASAPCDAVAFLASSGFSDEDDVCGEAASQDLLNVMQALSRREQAPRLYTITRNAFSVTDDDAPTMPAQGALAGLTRVAFNELGHEAGSLRATTIDLPRIVDNDLVDTLVEELQANDEKDEVALRQSGRYWSELGPSGIFAEASVTTINPASGARYDVRENADSGGVELVTTLPERLGNSDIELAVEAIAIDTDALHRAIGGDGGSQALMSVCARVSRAGIDRIDVEIGDRLAGFVPASLASHLRVDSATALLVPVSDAASASHVAGAAAPSALARRLADAAMLGAGDRAVVCATAEGEALATILEASDVVVHRLPGNQADWTNAALDAATADGPISAIAAPLAAWERSFGFDMLSAGGCLIDLDTGFAPLSGASQAGRLVRIDPAQEIARNASQLIAALEAALVDEAAAAPTAETLGLDALVQQPADALTGHSRRVIEMRADVELEAKASDNPGIREDAAYLVTGGFGGLGKETARWLLRHGAGHVALCGRRAGASDADQAFLAELQKEGFSASAHQCDLADAALVRDLVDELSAVPTPLRGVFHTAGVLEDKPLAELTADDMSRVIRPKALGAWNLHLATAQLPLDHFVLYSSISVLVGNSNQANYCAANGFLDSLAHFRRAHGQAAMSLNWGAIDTVGMLSQDEAIGRHLRQIGLEPIPFDEALNGMARAMSLNETQVCIASNPDWKKWASFETHGGHSPRFRTVVTQARELADDSVQARLRKQLLELGSEQRFEVLSGLIAEIFARELKTPADQIDPSMPLDFLGIDSLMATEIRVKLDDVLGLTISELELADHGSIAGLANKWHEQMELDQAAA